MIEKVLVLGSNSFSGANTIKVLLEKGYEVFGMSRSPQVPLSYRPYDSNTKGFHFLQLGSNFDTESVASFCKTNRISKLINFVAQSMVGQSWIQPEDWYETNCVWLAKLTNSLLKLDNFECFLHFSTPEVYGSTSGWQMEHFSFNPSTPYAISRAAGDQHLKILQEQTGFPVVLTRAANIYGPFQPRYRIVPRAIISALTNQRLKLDGGGSSERSFIFADDVSNALVGIIEKRLIGKTYHISTNHTLTIRALVEEIFGLLGAEFDSIVDVVADRPGKDSSYLLNSDKIRVETGWQESVNLVEGLSDTIAWAKDHLDSLLALPPEYVHRS